MTRTWADVPYVEKVGLALSVMNEPNKEQRLDAMTKRIGFERLRAATRKELEELIKVAGQTNRSR